MSKDKKIHEATCVSCKHSSTREVISAKLRDQMQGWEGLVHVCFKYKKIRRYLLKNMSRLDQCAAENGGERFVPDPFRLLSETSDMLLMQYLQDARSNGMKISDIADDLHLDREYLEEYMTNNPKKLKAAHDRMMAYGGIYAKNEARINGRNNILSFR